MQFTFKKISSKPDKKEGTASTTENPLGKSVERIKRKSADYLGKKAAKISPGAQFGWLLFYMISTGGFCLYLMAQIFSGEHKIPSFTPEKKPWEVPASEGQSYNSDATLNEMERERIESFSNYMDSLRQISTGHAYDSIVQARPGLMDSLAIVERYYESQFKD
jgi:hypothetical protein